MPIRTKRIIFIFSIILLLAIITLSVYWFCFRPNPETKKNYRINYDMQGYLFKETDEGRVFVENTTFIARNPFWPKKVKDGEINSDKTSFEYISIADLPVIENETALNTSRYEPRNGLFKVDIIKGGGKQDSETGKLWPITEVRYIMFIDEKTNELLLCQIFMEKDGENQQYFFSPANDLDYINDIMIRGYTG